MQIKQIYKIKTNTPDSNKLVSEVVKSPSKNKKADLETKLGKGRLQRKITKTKETLREDLMYNKKKILRKVRKETETQETEQRIKKLQKRTIYKTPPLKPVSK